MEESFLSGGRDLPSALWPLGAHAWENSLFIRLFLIRAPLEWGGHLQVFPAQHLSPFFWGGQLPLISAPVVREWLTQPGSMGASGWDPLRTIPRLGLPLARMGEPGPRGQHVEKACVGVRPTQAGAEASHGEREAASCCAQSCPAQVSCTSQ